MRAQPESNNITFDKIVRFIEQDNCVYTCRNCYFPVIRANEFEVYKDLYRIMIIRIENLVRQIYNFHVNL